MSRLRCRLLASCGLACSGFGRHCKRRQLALPETYTHSDHECCAHERTNAQRCSVARRGWQRARARSNVCRRVAARRRLALDAKHRNNRHGAGRARRQGAAGRGSFGSAERSCRARRSECRRTRSRSPEPRLAPTARSAGKSTHGESCVYDGPHVARNVCQTGLARAVASLAAFATLAPPLRRRASLPRAFNELGFVGI